MITNPNPVLAVYNSGIHCPACAEAKFGQGLYDREGVTDDEDNPVSLVFDWNYSPPREGEYCECGREIAEPSVPDLDPYHAAAVRIYADEDEDVNIDPRDDMSDDDFSVAPDAVWVRAWVRVSDDEVS